MVYTLSLILLGDRDEALDLSQEVFLRVFRTIHGFRGQSSLKTWIYRIVINQARNRQRFWRRRRRADQVSLDQHVAEHGDLTQPGDGSVQPTLSNYTAAEIYVTAERIHQVAAERARAILEAAAERLKDAGCSFELEQLDGESAETIARRASELGCESITMGTHGLSSFGILFMGSVAQRVVHHATVPVTLVK